MEKKILLAVDGGQASAHAIDYVGLMAGSAIRDLLVTVFYVMNPIPPFLRREGQTDPAAYKRLKALQTKYSEEAIKVINEARERLVRHGLDQELIQVKMVPRGSDAARVILFEAEQGLYDALVIGRRDISKAQEIFVGSTTNKIVHHSERLPIWVVGGKVESRKVLCAVDGSEGSLKAVDHMAFMLGGNPEVEVTLLHVAARLASYCTLDFSQEMAADLEVDIMQSDQRCMDDFYARAQRVLMEGGLAAEQIKTLDRASNLGVARVILDEVKRNGYGTVVLGRRGENKSFFLGHVGDKVISRGSEAAAIWLVG